jgi:1-acyl-sn-glycerol-3-phosphate acyltransferase
MAVNTSSEAGDAGSDFSPGEVGVDTRFTPIYRILRFLVRGLNRLLFRTTVEGEGLVPTDGPVIIAPIHRSFIDFFVVSEVTRRKLHYMAKDSLWKQPRFGRFLLSIGAFPVHREAADREALRRAQNVLEAGEVLILFPEGERRTGDTVGELHEGAAFLAARTGATIVPVGIGGTMSVMPKGTRYPRPSKVHLIVGEPLAAPARSAAGRVPRSQVHKLTEDLRVSIQHLYQRAVATTGHP